MQPICIVTDTSAQFPKRAGEWYELIKILPIAVNEQPANQVSVQPAAFSPDDVTASAFSLPLGLSRENQNKIKNFLYSVAYDFQQILFILPTKTFFPSYALIAQTLEQMTLPTVFNLIDSHSFGYGLGWLTQTCAEYLRRGQNLGEVKRFLHKKITHLYTLVYFPDLTYLSRSNVLDPDQAYVGGFLGIRPLILLENDQIIPYQKTRNFKNLVDSMIEYAHEFEQIEYIGLHFGSSTVLSERKSLQNRLQTMLPRTPIDTQVMNDYLNQTLGEQSICMILIESDKK